MGTGLIYAAIVAAWAAYLVPAWLRRHGEVFDDQPEVPDNSSDHLVRVLPRRTKPGSPRAATAGPSLGRDPAPRMPTAPAVIRRRRVLACLIALSTVVGVLGALDLVPWWALAVPVSVVALFLTISAAVAQRHRTDARRRVSRAAASSRPAAPHRSSTRRSSVPPQPARSSAGPPAARVGAERVTPPAAAGAGSTPHPAATPRPRRRRPEDSGLWDPIEVPLPTYLTKAKASRTVRTVDLGSSAGELPEWDLLHRPDDAPAVLLDETDSAERSAYGLDIPDQSDDADTEPPRAVGH
ncbi:MAG TPA: hypothetical protein VIL34_09245 [Actinopolymorphaceae bacterium]